jgi:hypothetical protein
MFGVELVNKLRELLSSGVDREDPLLETKKKSTVVNSILISVNQAGTTVTLSETYMI